MTTIALVSCGKKKRDVPSPARTLYTGALVEKSLEHATRSADQTFIISAKLGLLPLDQVVEPYDLKLTDLPNVERIAWGRRVVGQLTERFGRETSLTFRVYASAEYTKHVRQAALTRQWQFVDPLEGWGNLPLGMRLQALTRALEEISSRTLGGVTFPRLGFLVPPVETETFETNLQQELLPPANDSFLVSPDLRAQVLAQHPALADGVAHCSYRDDE